MLGEAGVLPLWGSSFATLRPSGEIGKRRAFVLPIAPVLLPLKAPSPSTAKAEEEGFEPPRALARPPPGPPPSVETSLEISLPKRLNHNTA